MKRNLLLFIHAHPGTEETLRRHWKYFERAGASRIIGIEPKGSRIKWPKDIMRLDIGETPKHGGTLCRQLIDTFAYGLSFPEATHFAVTEYDSVFLKALPDELAGFWTHVGGHKSPGFKANNYFHTPWIADRETAYKVVAYGHLMLAENDIEGGHPDRFIGWMFERFNLPFTRLPAYTQNSFDRPEFVEEARRAVRNGVYFLHGIKTAAQLEQIMTP
jgi:hypothetical protein